MPRYSRKSEEALATCDPRLQGIFHDVIEAFDCSILEGHRERQRQNDLKESGKSQVRWPNSKHNSVPSKAVDVAPFPIDWEDRERMTLFAGYVMGIAAAHGVPLRWGGCWRMDWSPANNNFDDLVHFELVD